MKKMTLALILLATAFVGFVPVDLPARRACTRCYHAPCRPVYYVPAPCPVVVAPRPAYGCWNAYEMVPVPAIYSPCNSGCYRCYAAPRPSFSFSFWFN